LTRGPTAKLTSHEKNRLKIALLKQAGLLEVSRLKKKMQNTLVRYNEQEQCTSCYGKHKMITPNFLPEKTLVYSPNTPHMYHYARNAKLCKIENNYTVITREEVQEKKLQLCFVCEPAEIDRVLVNADEMPTPKYYHLYGDIRECQVKRQLMYYDLADAQRENIPPCPYCKDRYFITSAPWFDRNVMNNESQCQIL